MSENFEILPQKGSSNDGEVVYAKPGAFSRSIKKIANSNDKERAVYTEAPESRLGYTEITNDVLLAIGMFGYFHKPVSMAGVAAEMQQRRVSAQGALNRGRITADTYTKAINFINTKEREIAILLKRFPGYKVAYTNVHANSERGSERGDPELHRDRAFGKDTIVLISTQWGQSTWYKAKSGDTLIVPPDRSLVAHIGGDDGIKHRSPDYGATGKRRFALVVVLVKEE